MLGKIEGKKRRLWQRMRWLDSITDSKHMNLSKPCEIVEGRVAWHAVVLGITKSDMTQPRSNNMLQSLGFPGESEVKDLLANAGDTKDVGQIPEEGISLGEGYGDLLQYFCLGNSMDRGAWSAVLEVAKELDMTQQLSNKQHALVTSCTQRQRQRYIFHMHFYSKVYFFRKIFYLCYVYFMLYSIFVLCKLIRNNIINNNNNYNFALFLY